MTESTTPQLTEREVEEIEAHLVLETDADAVSVLAQVPALIRDWRALQAELADVKGPQFERRVDKVRANFEKQNAAMRDKCIETIKSTAAQWEAFAGRSRGAEVKHFQSKVEAARDLVSYVESLTLDQVEQKQR